MGSVLKYGSPILSVATLVYGICNDHPFHNGNKRTALVAMLAHLDKNKLALYNTSQGDLYEFMLRVASHTVSGRPDKRKARPKGLGARPTADEEVRAIARWIGDRAARVVRGESLITYRELKKILESFGFHLQNPKNNSIDIAKPVERKRGILKRKTVTEYKRIGNIPWPGERREVSLKVVKYVRELCGLREEDGVDSDTFYNYAIIIDSFVNYYRKVLKRLART